MHARPKGFHLVGLLVLLPFSCDRDKTNEVPDHIAASVPQFSRPNLSRQQEKFRSADVEMKGEEAIV